MEIEILNDKSDLVLKNKLISKPLLLVQNLAKNTRFI